MSTTVLLRDLLRDASLSAGEHAHWMLISGPLPKEFPVGRSAMASGIWCFSRIPRRLLCCQECSVCTDAFISYTFSLHICSIFFFISWNKALTQEQLWGMQLFWRATLKICLWVWNQHMLLVKRHFEGSITDWGFVDIWFICFHALSEWKKKKITL